MVQGLIDTMSHLQHPKPIHRCHSSPSVRRTAEDGTNGGGGRGQKWKMGSREGTGETMQGESRNGSLLCSEVVGSELIKVSGRTKMVSAAKVVARMPVLVIPMLHCQPFAGGNCSACLCRHRSLGIVRSLLGEACSCSGWACNIGVKTAEQGVTKDSNSIWVTDASELRPIHLFEDLS